MKRQVSVCLLAFIQIQFCFLVVTCCYSNFIQQYSFTVE